MLHRDMVSEEEDFQYHPYFKDRPRGILTPHEREYLSGESEIEEGSQQERSIRQSIRNHVIHSILDFSIIRANLEDRDREMVFTPSVDGNIEPIEFYKNSNLTPADRPPEELAKVPVNYVNAAAIDIISFLFQQFDNPNSFARKTEEAIERSAYTAGHDIRADVEIDVEVGEPIEEIYDRLEQDGIVAMELRELRLLRDSGKLELVRYHELAAEWLNSDKTSYDLGLGKLDEEEKEE